MIQKGLVGPKVFVNCCSFIRIRASHFHATYTDSGIDCLDDTRVHPEDYDLARKMAADALDLDEGVLDDEDHPSQHVQELMDTDPDKLNLLMLEEYAVELEKQFNEPKLQTLLDIKAELQDPFVDKRKYSPPSHLQIFTMLSGETLDSLKPGSLVSCSVVKTKDRFVVCALASGLDALLFQKEMNLAEELYHTIPQLFPPRSSLEARILRVDVEKMQVELSCLPYEDPGPMVDADFDRQRERDDEDLVPQQRRKQVQRVIAHPFFKQMDYKQAETYLSAQPVGQVIIRPSTKGATHISITFKTDKETFQHLDVFERVKDDVKVLLIDELEFQELDQIIAEWIEPIIKRIKKLTTHTKFQRKSISQMSIFLNNAADYLTEQARTLKRSAYGFIPSDQPGMYYLIYKHVNNSRKMEHVLVKPEGFLFRQKMFPNVDALLGYFKTDEAQKAQRRPAASSRPAYR